MDDEVQVLADRQWVGDVGPYVDHVAVITPVLMQGLLIARDEVVRGNHSAGPAQDLFVETAEHRNKMSAEKSSASRQRAARS